MALYGPPACGKDTVTAELVASGERFAHFHRLKAGPGRTRGYRMTDPQSLADLRQQGQILHSNSRYGAEYATDIPELDRLTSQHLVPVVHVGQVEALTALAAYPAEWLHVLLWCPADVTAARSAHRGDTDVPARLTAWKETFTDLADHPDVRWSVIVRTDRLTPARVAASIRQAVKDRLPNLLQSLTVLEEWE